MQIWLPQRLYVAVSRLSYSKRRGWEAVSAEVRGISSLGSHLSLDRGCRGMSSSRACAECMRGMPPRTRPSSLAPPRWHLSHSDSLLCERMLPGDSRPDSKAGLLVMGLMLIESLLG